MLQSLFFAICISQSDLPELPADIYVSRDSKIKIGKVSVEHSIRLIDDLIHFAKQRQSEEVERVLKGAFADQRGPVRITYCKSYVALKFSFIRVKFDPTSGRLQSMSMTPMVGIDNRRPNLSEEQCFETVTELYKMCGGKYNLAKGWFLKQGQSEGTVNVQMNINAPSSKYALGSVETVLDRTSGLPDYLLVSSLPSFVKESKVSDKSDIEFASALTICEKYGWNRVQVGIQEPRYRVPDFAKYSNAMSERHRSLVKDRKACLVFEVSVNDATSFDASKNAYSRFVQVYLDAETGSVIAELPVFQMQGSSSNISVNVDDSSAVWFCGDVKGKLTKVAPSESNKSKLVVLRNLKGGVIVGKYDAVKNILSYMQSGRNTFVRPDAMLAKQLKGYSIPNKYHRVKLVKPS